MKSERSPREAKLDAVANREALEDLSEASAATNLISARNSELPPDIVAESAIGGSVSPRRRAHFKKMA